MNRREFLRKIGLCSTLFLTGNVFVSELLKDEKKELINSCLYYNSIQRLIQQKYLPILYDTMFNDNYYMLKLLKLKANKY